MSATSSENREYFAKALEDAINRMFEEEMANIDPDIDASCSDDHKRKLNAIVREIDLTARFLYPEVEN